MAKKKHKPKKTTLVPSTILGIAIETDEAKTQDYLRGLQGGMMHIDVVSPDQYQDLREAAFDGDLAAAQLMIDCASALHTSAGMQCLVCDEVIPDYPGGLVRLRKADPADRAFIILPLCLACAKPHDGRMRQVEQGLTRLLFPGARFFRDDLHPPGHA